MRKFYLFCLLALSLGACKKESADPDPGSQSFSDKIVLQQPRLVGDSVDLSWSRLDNAALIDYQVIRRESPTAMGTVITPYSFGVNPVIINNFRDKDVPYTTRVEYQVQARLVSGQPVLSNRVSFDRANIKPINAQAFDVQFDATRRQLYFFEAAGTIRQYDVANEQMTNSISTGATIGYCDFAVYNGVRELYVPRNDGWVFVYNAETLAKLDQINVGTAATSVVASNNLLYVSTDSWLSRPLKVYSRATKTLITETGDWNKTRLKRIPGTTTSLLELTLNIGPPDSHFYSFTATGGLLTHFPDRYHGDHPLDARIFEVLPNGTRFITSEEGSIYGTGLLYEGSLPRGNLRFTTFGFDAAGQSIFAGTTTKTVEVYAANGYTRTRTINTKAYPFRLFQDGANMLCVSSSAPVVPYGTPTQLVVEALR